MRLTPAVAVQIMEVLCFHFKVSRV